MEIIITAKELIDKGIWDEACELLGINIGAVNAGLMSSDYRLSFTQEQANKIGLLDLNL